MPDAPDHQPIMYHGIDLSTDPRSREIRQTPLDYREVFYGKTGSSGTDPCELASRASMACLDRYAYNRSACREFFEDFKICKAKWTKQRWSDIFAGKGDFESDDRQNLFGKQ